MKKFTAVAGLIVFSSASQASTSFEEKQAQYIQEHQTAVANYAAKIGKPMPEVEDYRYGMKIDVAKFVRQSQDPRTCQVFPRLMTFEDSLGTLKTVRYSMYSQCINNK